MRFRGIATLLGAASFLIACEPKTAVMNSMEAMANSPVSCPGKSFEEFLKRFAGDEKIRTAFTADQVAVVDYQDPDSLEQTDVVVKHVPRAEYKDFTLTHDGNAYHNIDAAGVVDPSPVDINIERRGTDYLVRYVYGMSEGNSWLFKPSGACWILSEDPEPATQ